MRRWALAGAALLITMVAPAVGATTLQGVGTDPAGDGPVPGRDLTAVAASYDDVGSASVTVTLASAPSATERSFVFAVLGKASGSSCGAPFVALGGSTDGTSGVWALDTDDPSAYEMASLTRDGAKLTLSASSPRMAARGVDCVTARLTESPTVFDQLDAPAPLAAPAAPPTPAPAPAAGPPASGPPPSKPRGAHLTLTVGGVPRVAHRNRWVKLRIVVTNAGAATAHAVRLAAGTARGLTAKPRRVTIARLAPGRHVTRTFVVRLTKRARASTTLTFSVRVGSKIQGRARVVLDVGAAKRPPRGGRPSPPAGPLVGTYWWRTQTRVDYAWDNRGVYFVDDRWAYRGLPKGRLPSCTAVTATVNAKGEEQDGCLTYTYNSHTGELTLGDKAGTFRAGKLTIDGDAFKPLVVPRPGTRWQVALVNKGFSGFCGLITGCTTWTDTLILTNDGQFVLSSQSVSTLGDGSATPFTAVASYPPDQRGTYQVLAGGTLHLAYADGSVKDKTIAVQTTDAGAPDPVREGLMLDNTNYYPDAS